MRPASVRLVVVALVAVLTACGDGGSNASGGPVVTAPPASTRPLTRVDPCRVVTAAEASALAGAPVGRGRESTVLGRRRCVYGAGTLLVVTVEVSRAASAAEGLAAFAGDVARARSALTQQLPGHLLASLTVSDVSGVGDRAAIGTYSTFIAGETVGVSAIYVLDGPTFLTFSDVNLSDSAPDDAAMELQARTSLGRL
jgi:hypothetical protein